MIRVESASSSVFEWFVSFRFDGSTIELIFRSRVLIVFDSTCTMPIASRLTVQRTSAITSTTNSTPNTHVIMASQSASTHDQSDHKTNSTKRLSEMRVTSHKLHTTIRQFLYRF